MEEEGRRDGCVRGWVCGGAFIIIFVCAYVRGGGLHPREIGTRVWGKVWRVTVWWSEIEKGGGGSGAGGKRSMGRGAG